MIGQSMINVNSGGRGRLSGITAALCLLLFILVGSSLIEKIPLAALIGVMFIVVIGTFEWSSFRVIRKVPRSDALVLVLVSAVTVRPDFQQGLRLPSNLLQQVWLAGVERPLHARAPGLRLRP